MLLEDRVRLALLSGVGFFAAFVLVNEWILVTSLIAFGIALVGK